MISQSAFPRFRPEREPELEPDTIPESASAVERQEPVTRALTSDAVAVPDAVLLRSMPTTLSEWHEQYGAFAANP